MPTPDHTAPAKPTVAEKHAYAIIDILNEDASTTAPSPTDQAAACSSRERLLLAQNSDVCAPILSSAGIGYPATEPHKNDPSVRLPRALLPASC